MMFKMAVIVFVASIIAFFAEEFKRLFTKIFAIPGFKLLGPLAFASWLIYIFEDKGLYWFLSGFKRALHQMEQKLSKLLLHTDNISWVRIVFLFLVASIPVWVSLYLAHRKKRFDSSTFSYGLGLTLWIFAAILLTVS